MLPEPDSISCFLCIFLSNYETGKLLSAIAFVVPDPHIHTLCNNTCRSNSRQVCPVCFPALSNWTTASNNSPRSFSNTMQQADSRPMLHSLRYMCVHVTVVCLLTHCVNKLRRQWSPLTILSHSHLQCCRTNKSQFVRPKPDCSWLVDSTILNHPELHTCSIILPPHRRRLDRRRGEKLKLYIYTHTHTKLKCLSSVDIWNSTFRLLAFIVCLNYPC